MIIIVLQKYGVSYAKIPRQMGDPVKTTGVSKFCLQYQYTNLMKIKQEIVEKFVEDRNIKKSAR